jgi:hypothetical protein
MHNEAKYIRLPNIAVCIIAIAILSTRLFCDFWNDEVYSIINFVCVPLSKTCTDYHVPNNHVFSNLLQNIYLKLLGAPTCYDVLKAPIYLRSFALLQNLILFFVCFKIGVLLKKPLLGALLIVLLVCTPAFYYVALEQRGYGLSITLIVIMLWQIIAFLISNKTRHIVWTSISTAFLLYNIPSNLIFISGLCVALSLLLLMHFIKPLPFISLGKTLKMIIGITIGIGFSALLYYPIINKVLHNPYVDKDAGVTKQLTGEIIGGVWQGTVSYYYLLLIFGVVYSVIIRGVSKTSLFSLLTVSAVFATSYYLMLWLKLPAPFRIFTFVIPTVVLFVASLLHDVIAKQMQNILGLCCIVFLCGAHLYRTIQNNKTYLKAQLLENKRPQEFGVNYYQHFFEPNKAMQIIKHAGNKKVVLYGCEPHDAPHYLDAYQIEYKVIDNLNQLQEYAESFVLLTSFPEKVMQQTKVDLLTKELSYFTVFQSK